MTNSSEVCECGHFEESHIQNNKKSFCHSLDEKGFCECKKFKPQTPQKTKDLICPICKGIFSRDKKHTCTCHILKNNTQTPPIFKILFK